MDEGSATPRWSKRRRPRTERNERDPPRPRRGCALGTVAVLAAASAAQGAVAFTGMQGRPTRHHLISTPRERRTPRWHLSTQDEAAPLAIEPMPSSADPPSADVLLRDPSTFISTDNPVALYGGASLAIVSLALLSCTPLPSTMAAAYTSLLVEHPLPTKSLTSGVLCGISDVVAQARDDSRREFNFGRLVRFAGKGCIGGIIWSFWYDNLDRFLDMNSEVNVYTLTGLAGGRGNAMAYEWIQEHVGLVTTALSIVIEQFVWCPIVFGSFEIPVSTLLNGGSFSTVRKEVGAKLDGLLVSNAKVWTLANVVIYNAPVEWRPAISNLVDLVWQSIVSDVAADCGKVDDDVCEVPLLEDLPSEKDYAFYAEKSRL